MLTVRQADKTQGRTGSVRSWEVHRFDLVVCAFQRVEVGSIAGSGFPPSRKDGECPQGAQSDFYFHARISRSSWIDRSSLSDVVSNVPGVSETPLTFAESWLKFRSSRVGTDAWEANEWVVGAEVLWSQDDPDKLMKAIRLLASRCLTETEQAALGSGPIEALLAFHFDNFCEAIFDIARENENVRNALRVVLVEDYDVSEFNRLMQMIE